MSDNPNKHFFRSVYPEHWIAGQEERVADRSHYQYQQITLDRLDCYSGCTLFECGCGSGELLLRIAKQYENTQNFGIDLGRDSLLWAKNSSLDKYSPNLIEGNITSLPVKDNSFDRVFASSVLWYIPEPQLAIREMIRILKPGGKFVFDVRNPYHISNWLSQMSLRVRKIVTGSALQYSFFSPGAICEFLSTLPITFEVIGYFVLLPTRLPILGRALGDWSHLSPWLSFQAGQGYGKWFSQKLLISGNKLLK